MRARPRRPLRYWLSPPYTSRKAQIEALELVVNAQEEQLAWMRAVILALGEARAEEHPPQTRHLSVVR